MAKLQPIAVRERTAAQMLELRVEEFRAWADAVELQPCLLAGERRYSVAEMQAKLRGDMESPEGRY
jgi:hypothetical protein